MHRVPSPSDTWTYTETAVDDADIILRLSVSVDAIGRIRKHDFHFKRTEIRPVDGFQELRSFQRSASIECADGPKGWCNSTMSVQKVTPSGVSIGILCSYSEGNVKGDIDQEITVPYTRIDQRKVETVTLSWEWIDKRRPNQTSDGIRQPADVLPKPSM